MSQVHVGQTISLSLDTDLTLSGASVAQIHYRKPNGVTGAWNGTVVGDTITYTTSSSDIDIAGNWRLQAYAEISGAIRKGKVVTQQFKVAI